jgi:Ca2+-binding RTX toxin-like protein
VVDGGAGVDTIESDYYGGDSSSGYLPVAFTLGGGADDGRPGEGDDVRGVERLVLSTHGRIVGTDGPEYVKLHQVGGNGELIGNGGDDELRGGDGADKIDGGAGADVLDAGFGDDTIIGGPGRDRISADLAGGDCGPLWCKLPYGNDTVDARDGEVDSIDCGAGQDTVKADAADVVAPTCETVDRGAAPPAPAGGGTAQPGRPAEAGGNGAPARVTVVANRRLRAALTRGVTLSVPGLAARARVQLLSGRRTVARGVARTPAA